LGIFVEENKIKLTPYDRYMIPSPMSLIEYPHKHCLIEIDFYENYMYFVDCHYQLYRLKYTFPD